MSFLVEMVVNRGVDGDEFLQSSPAPEPKHCTFSSSKRQVRILNPAIEPATCFLAICFAGDFQRSAIGPKLVCHQDFGLPVAFY